MDITQQLAHALHDCLNAMNMQEQRESEHFHINQQTASYIWNNAKQNAINTLNALSPQNFAHLNTKCIYLNSHDPEDDPIDNFEQSLQRNSNTVQNWPNWRKQQLGQLPPQND